MTQNRPVIVNDWLRHFSSVQFCIGTCTLVVFMCTLVEYMYARWNISIQRTRIFLIYSKRLPSNVKIISWKNKVTPLRKNNYYLNFDRILISFYILDFQHSTRMYSSYMLRTLILTLEILHVIWCAILWQKFAFDELRDYFDSWRSKFVENVLFICLRCFRELNLIFEIFFWKKFDG